jgi:hypothetical protein
MRFPLRSGIFFLVVLATLIAPRHAHAETDPAPMPSSSPAPSSSHPNPHWVGFGNLFVPGLGATLNGNPTLGIEQFAYETTTFAAGYAVSPTKGFNSLDGIRDTFQGYSSKERNFQSSIDDEMYSDILLEFSIKTHMTNTFLAYRDALKAQGITDGIDQRTFWEGFTTPFQKETLTDPWVYVPLAAIFAALVVDYVTSQPDNSLSPLTPRSNFLFAGNYGIWQPLGSGWPEEAFFRGYLQREFTEASGSPLLANLAQATLFAFSHEAGSGRISAFAVGAYLGYLAQRDKGNLGSGITVHFWGDLLLGAETILLSNRNQRSTPQAAFGVQFNY